MPVLKSLASEIKMITKNLGEDVVEEDVEECEGVAATERVVVEAEEEGVDVWIRWKSRCKGCRSASAHRRI